MNAAARRLLRGGAAARSMLIASGVLGAMTALAIVAQAALMAYVVSEAFIDGADLESLKGPLLVLLAVALLRAVLAGGFELSGRLGAQRVMARLRGELIEHLLIERPARDEGERSGELASAAVQGVDSIETYFARYLPQVILAALVPPTILIVAAINDWQAALVLLLTAPLIPVFMILIGRSAEDATRARWQTLSLLSAHFLDVVRGLPTLRAHGRADAQAETMDRVGEQLNDETMGTLRIAFTSALVLELLAMIGTGLVAAVVGVQLAAGSLGFQAGLTVLLLAPELYQPFRQVGVQYHAAADGLAAAERIFEVLDTPSSIDSPADPLPAPSPAATTLRLEDIGVTYAGRGEQALSDINLSIAPGEKIALTGSSGSGKSTIAALLARLIDPTTGAVTCGGIDLREVAPNEWRSMITWVPQRPHVFALSLRDNVALGARASIDDERVRGALAAVGLEDLEHSSANGLHTILGEGGRQLSLGEQQRLGLARAWLRRSPLIVLDEPTAYLDRDAAELAREAIAELADGRSLVLITHDERLAQLADRRIQLDNGRLSRCSGGRELVA